MMYKELYDLDLNITQKVTKKNTLMWRIDLGPIQKIPLLNQNNQYYTCMGVFFNEKSIFMCLYNHYYFKPIKIHGKKWTSLTPIERLKLESKRELSPWFSRVKLDPVKICIKPTKKGKYRFLCFNKFKGLFKFTPISPSGDWRTLGNKIIINDRKAKQSEMLLIYLKHCISHITVSKAKHDNSMSYGDVHLISCIVYDKLHKKLNEVLEKRDWTNLRFEPLEKLGFSIKTAAEDRKYRNNRSHSRTAIRWK